MEGRKELVFLGELANSNFSNSQDTSSNSNYTYEIFSVSPVMESERIPYKLKCESNTYISDWSADREYSSDWTNQPKKPDSRNL